MTVELEAGECVLYGEAGEGRYAAGEGNGNGPERSWVTRSSRIECMLCCVVRISET